MDLGLNGKNVVITGASRGIGRAIALAFAREGASVAICARGESALMATAAELNALGVNVYAAGCDVADRGDLDAFLVASRAMLGGVDVLVNNPSGFGVTDDEEGWLVGWEVDVMASVRASWRVAPWMESSGWGSIVHISSIAALEAGPIPPYAAAKAALLAHSKNMATLLAPKGIRINVVAPGSIEFPDGYWDRERQRDPIAYETMRSAMPFGRLGTPEEVAAAVVFVASPRASWIAGAMLVVDGAQHKGIF
ncbi:SDR family NAD(P)-dependent oxidoreductase [Paraburkholderia domus]|uniref:SDR family NAD(P)-dependent oxidoreductase n=1 Tax=Paraburkholderia domus TaxID=2793075 RepID=UPI001B23BC73|nr:SDR family oxidoreductase [Paraburkholderia domus]CAE6851312.1 7-alpha-hydroxysteroid dehydrogenase [Paraburkholderia domus]